MGRNANMSLLKWLNEIFNKTNEKQNNRKKVHLKSEIEKIEGLKVIEKFECQYIQFSTALTCQDLQKLIHLLRKHKIVFSVYDFLYPSISDPGAYMSYSQLNNESEKHWNMTLGNHGWSGGVYQIEEPIVLKQLENLIEKNLIQDIQIERVVFFSHYKNAEPNRNQIENDRILEIHTNLDTPQ